jgi:hypothetical protein
MHFRGFLNQSLNKIEKKRKRKKNSENKEKGRGRRIGLGQEASLAH